MMTDRITRQLLGMIDRYESNTGARAHVIAAHWSTRDRAILEHNAARRFPVVEHGHERFTVDGVEIREAPLGAYIP